MTNENHKERCLHHISLKGQKCKDTILKELQYNTNEKHTNSEQSRL